ncbi:MAG: hypothetical protein D6770_05185, partial [Anaerolineae bacterium]
QFPGFQAGRVEGWQLAADTYAAHNDASPNAVVPLPLSLTAAPTEVTLPPHSVTFLTLTAHSP